jgi:hypothetical protein
MFVTANYTLPIALSSTLRSISLSFIVLEERYIPSKYARPGLFLVVLFSFSAWSLRVSFLGFDALSDLTLEGVLNKTLRLAIFVGPVLFYLKYGERARVLIYLINTLYRKAQ